MTKRLKAYVFLLTAVAIWGFAGPVIKFTLKGIDPFPFLAYRFLISGLLGLVFLLISRPKIPKPRESILLSSALGVLAYALALSLLFTGLKESTVLDLTLIGTVSPLLILIGGAIIFKDRITHRERLGALIALIGTAIAVIVPALMNSGARLSGNILLYGFLFADSSSIMASKYLLKKGIPPSILTNVGMISGAVFFILLVSVTYGFANFITLITTLPLQYHLGVLYMAVFSGTIAYYCMIRGTRTIEVSEAGLFYYLQPLFTVPVAILWLGETITPMFIVGATIITSGVFLAEYKRHLRKRR